MIQETHIRKCDQIGYLVHDQRGLLYARHILGMLAIMQRIISLVNRRHSSCNA